MNRDLIITEVYRTALEHEFEKTAAPILKGGRSLLKILWSPAGSTAGLRSAARQQYRQTMRAGTRDLSAARRAVGRKERMLSDLRRTRGLQQSQVDKFQRAGFLEGALQGRFGTRALRERRLGQAVKLRGVTQGQITRGKNELKALRSKATRLNKPVNELRRTARADYESATRNIGLRQAANFGARAGILGGGGLAAYSALKPRSQSVYYG